VRRRAAEAEAAEAAGGRQDGNGSTASLTESDTASSVWAPPRFSALVGEEPTLELVRHRAVSAAVCVATLAAQAVGSARQAMAAPADRAQKRPRPGDAVDTRAPGVVAGLALGLAGPVAEAATQAATEVEDALLEVELWLEGARAGAEAERGAAGAAAGGGPSAAARPEAPAWAQLVSDTCAASLLELSCLAASACAALGPTSWEGRALGPRPETLLALAERAAASGPAGMGLSHTRWDGAREAAVAACASLFPPCPEGSAARGGGSDAVSVAPSAFTLSSGASSLPRPSVPDLGTTLQLLPPPQGAECRVACLLASLRRRNPRADASEWTSPPLGLAPQLAAGALPFAAIGVPVGSHVRSEQRASQSHGEGTLPARNGASRYHSRPQRRTSGAREAMDEPAALRPHIAPPMLDRESAASPSYRPGSFAMPESPARAGMSFSSFPLHASPPPSPFPAGSVAGSGVGPPFLHSGPADSRPAAFADLSSVLSGLVSLPPDRQRDHGGELSDAEPFRPFLAVPLGPETSRPQHPMGPPSLGSWSALSSARANSPSQGAAEALRDMGRARRESGAHPGGRMMAPRGAQSAGGSTFSSVIPTRGAMAALRPAAGAPILRLAPLEQLARLHREEEQRRRFSQEVLENRHPAAATGPSSALSGKGKGAMMPPARVEHASE